MARYPKPNFYTNWICYWQIRFCPYYAFSLNQNIWYYWSLKTLANKRWFLFNFAKALQNRHFVVGGRKNFKLLGDVSLESGLQNIVLSRLLLFSCACCYIDLGDIHWNKVATSTACNFNNSWQLYLNFSNMINPFPNIWFIENSKCDQYLFWKTNRQKITNFSCFQISFIS